MSSYMGKQALKQKDLPANTAKWFKYNPAEAKKLLEAAGQKDLRSSSSTSLAPQRPAASAARSGTSCATRSPIMLRQGGLKITAVQQDYAKDYVDSGKGSRQGYFPNDSWFLPALRQPPMLTSRSTTTSIPAAPPTPSG